MPHHETQVQKPMEERVTEEVSNLIYKVPIPLSEFRQDCAVAFRQNVQMGLRQRSSSEQGFQKDFILSFRRYHQHDGGGLYLLFDCLIKLIKCILIRAIGELFLTGKGFAVFKRCQRSRAFEFVVY